MNAKDSGLVGLALAGILVSAIGIYVGYSGIAAESLLMFLVGVVVLVAGVTMAFIGSMRISS